MKSTMMLLVVTLAVASASFNTDYFTNNIGNARRYSSGYSSGSSKTPYSSGPAPTPTPPTPAPTSGGSTTIKQTFSFAVPTALTPSTYGASSFAYTMNFAFGDLYSIVDKTNTAWAFFAGCYSTSTLATRRTSSDRDIVAETVASPAKAAAATSRATSVADLSTTALQTQFQSTFTAAKVGAAAAATAAGLPFAAEITAMAVPTINSASTATTTVAAGDASSTATFSAVAALAIAAAALRQ